MIFYNQTYLPKLLNYCCLCSSVVATTTTTNDDDDDEVGSGGCLPLFNIFLCCNNMVPLEKNNEEHFFLQTFKYRKCTQ